MYSTFIHSSPFKSVCFSDFCLKYDINSSGITYWITGKNTFLSLFNSHFLLVLYSHLWKTVQRYDCHVEFIKNIRTFF